MLSTLHSCSNLGVKTDLELFSLPDTQFSHEGDDFIQYHPTTLKPSEAESTEFFIPNMSESYLDPSSIFIQMKARILRRDGMNTVEIKSEQVSRQTRSVADEPTVEEGASRTTRETPASDATTVAAVPANPDKVYPVESLLNSLFKHCDMYLNDQLISQHEFYAYRSYFDLLTQTNMAMKETYWPLLFYRDEPNQTLDIKDMERGLGKRYALTKGSRPFDMESPIFSDLCQQGLLLLPGVNMRLVFRLNPASFVLMTPEGETREYKVEILKFSLRVRYVKIADSVRLSHEAALKDKSALYLLRGMNTKIRSLPEASADIILENLCPERVPSKLTFLFVNTDGFYGNFHANPFKFEHLNIQKSALYVGSKVRRQDYDFDQDHFATAFVDLCRAIGNPHLELKREQYKSGTFMLHYNLAPDCGGGENLSPLQVDNVRLHIQLRTPLTKSVTCVILTETPRVMEINAARVVTLP